MMRSILAIVWAGSALAQTGLNFRASSGFVTDGSGEVYVLGDSYPTTRGGITFGWEDAPDGTRDRSRLYDHRLAGINFVANTSSTKRFRVDLPSTGIYQVRIALGDASTPQTNQKIVLEDSATSFATITNNVNTAAEFADSTSTVYTAANWVGSNTTVLRTFSSTILRAVVGANDGSGNASCLAHLYFEKLTAGTLTITTTSPLTTGTATQAFVQYMIASGGTPPYTWTLTSGTFPAGLTLGANGFYAGTPTTPGTYTGLAIRVTDSVSATASVTFSQMINAAPPVPLSISTKDLLNGVAGSAYSYQVNAVGGTAPYTFTLSSGTLPTGLSISSSGLITGTPTIVGWYGFLTITVTDAVAATNNLQFSMLVTPTTDIYGGLLSKSCTVTGWFHTTKIGSRWYLCTPLGHPMHMMALGNIHNGAGSTYAAVATAKYGDVTTNWANAQNKRLQLWGFNTVGQLSDSTAQPQTSSIKLPYILELPVGDIWRSTSIKDIAWGLNTNYTRSFRGRLQDYFDPNNWPAHLAHLQSSLGATPSPYLAFVLGDDIDYVWGGGAGADFPTALGGGQYNPDIHTGWLTLVTSPTQTFMAYPSGPNVTFTDLTVYSKASIASPPPSQCNVTHPCSLRDSLKLEYGTIGALNTAWSTSGFYTSFDSTGVTHTETVGTGNGSTTVFSFTLSSATGSPLKLSPLSVQVLEGGTVQAGDCPWWNPACGGSANTGVLEGGSSSTVTSGSINYSAATGTVTFSPAPGNGVSIQIRYITGGWMSGGTGLMDEDGSHSWVGNTDYFCLKATAFVCSSSAGALQLPAPTANATLATDLTAWISQFWGEYFGQYKAQLNSYNTTNSAQLMFLGIDTAGSWSAPARAELFQGASPYADAAFPELSPTGAMADYITSNLGDVPYIPFVSLASTADSYLFSDIGIVHGNWLNPGWDGGFDMDNQEDRARVYRDMVSLLLTRKSGAGTYPFVGASWWGLTDFINESISWGLVSTNDNPYDGKSSCQIVGVDPFGFATGGEPLVPGWQATTAYVLPNGIGNNRIQVAVAGTIYTFEPTVAGTSSSSQPSWPAAQNATVADGSVTWINRGVKFSATCFGDSVDYVKQANALWWPALSGSAIGGYVRISGSVVIQ